MNLKRQLLLVSVLTLVLPWAGYQFIRETESALRTGQQAFLAGTARAVSESLAQYPEEFAAIARGAPADQIYGHPLQSKPEIDGYFDDWSIERSSLRVLRGVDGLIRFALGVIDETVYLYVEVVDRQVVYARSDIAANGNGLRFSDRVSLINTSPLYLNEIIVFAAEAPGPFVAMTRDEERPFETDPEIRANWQDVPGGYQVEARIPASKLGTHLGIVVSNTGGELEQPARTTSFAAGAPGQFVTQSPDLRRVTAGLTQTGMRLIVTDAEGWRLAQTGTLARREVTGVRVASTWLRFIYDLFVETGEDAEFAEPDPLGREHQDYVRRALGGSEDVSWFRSPEDGRAIVAVAQPIRSADQVLGALILQQGTEAILSLTNDTLVRLMNVTLIATLLVAGALLGYATWLSRRIRRLSIAAEEALDGNDLRSSLPSARSGDEIGDLSRSFSHVLHQLGDYNDYLRSLASKLSHELRTPLAIVTSSLENLEHEALDKAQAGYAARAREGADRLRRILTAMSEASRVEELMQHAEPETFDLKAVLDSTVEAYRDVYVQRKFVFECSIGAATVRGSPELIIQMLDKLVDNAVGFSADGDTVSIALARQSGDLNLSVTNPGPPLPERMRQQMFDSMVSVRPGSDDKHLGLGLYVARLIAEGHGGKIDAENTDGGVTVIISIPGEKHGE